LLPGGGAVLDLSQLFRTLDKAGLSSLSSSRKALYVLGWLDAEGRLEQGRLLFAIHGTVSLLAHLVDIAIRFVLASD
jgi:hypothetical protein